MDSFITFLVEMPFWYWWVLALGLLILEIMTGTTYVLWPAAAAVIVGLLDLTIMDGQWQLQLMIFGVLTILFTIFITPHVREYVNNTKTDKEHLNQRGAQKVGKRATVSAAFENGKGKVRFGDTQWLAEGEGGVDIEAGQAVEIIDTQGTTLIVKPV